MKKMFTAKDQGLLDVEEEGSVYSFFDDQANKRTFLDANGNVLKNYTRPPIPDEEWDAESKDRDFFADIGDGFYTYTTHEVTRDMDGKYGLFGIKRNNGSKLTEEIYYQVGRFCNGLCSVRVENSKWGCIDTEGRLVIPYSFSDAMYFNAYGIAVGDHTLIDRFGGQIPDTALNCIDDCGEYNRYFVFAFLNEEQIRSIGRCGTAPNITLNIYDTKHRRYAVNNVPECRLNVHCFDGEPKVLVVATELLDQYDRIHLFQKGTLLCEKDGRITVYDYYQ